MTKAKNDEELQQYLTNCLDRYLSYRPRTEKELRRYIQQKLYKKRVDKTEYEPIISDRMQQLEQQGHVDDEAFAKWYVTEKREFKKYGSIRLQHELASKGISKSIIQKTLQNTQKSDAELLTDYLKNRYPDLSFEDRNEKQKFIQKLMRRGFSYPDIKRSIEESQKKE